MADCSDFSTKEVTDQGKIYPEGDYSLMVVSSKIVRSKTEARNSWFVFVMQILGGHYANQQFERWITKEHVDHKKVYWGKVEFKELRTACGFTDDIRDTDVLNGKTVDCKMSVTVSKTDSDQKFQQCKYSTRKRPVVAQTQPSQPAEGFAQEVFGGLEKQVNAPLDAPCWPVAS